MFAIKPKREWNRKAEKRKAKEGEQPNISKDYAILAGDGLVKVFADIP